MIVDITLSMELLVTQIMKFLGVRRLQESHCAGAGGLGWTGARDGWGTDEVIELVMRPFIRMD